MSDVSLGTRPGDSIFADDDVKKQWKLNEIVIFQDLMRVRR